MYVMGTVLNIMEKYGTGSRAYSPAGERKHMHGGGKDDETHKVSSINGSPKRY